MIISRVTSDSLHLSGLGGQTDGLSLISPESVVSTHQKYSGKGLEFPLVPQYLKLGPVNSYQIFRARKFGANIQGPIDLSSRVWSNKDNLHLTSFPV